MTGPGPGSFPEAVAPGGTAMAVGVEATAPKRAGQFGRRAKEAGLGYLLILPSLAVFGVFVFYPFLRNFDFATHQAGFVPGAPKPYVGGKQFRSILDADQLLKSFVTTLPWVVLAIVLIVGFTYWRRHQRGVLEIKAASVLNIVLGFAGLLVAATLFHFVQNSEVDFANSLKLTVLFALYTVPAGIALGILLAVLAHQRLRGIAIYRTIFSSTVASSVAVASVIFFTLLNPNVGIIASWLHLSRSPLDDPTWALVWVSIVTIWQNLGLTFILMSAALQAVPDDLLEAARVDGAGAWSRFRNVIIPMISPTIFFTSVVGLILAFQSFGQIDILTKGGPQPGDHTNLIIYSVYTALTGSNADEGRAAVLAIALFVLLFFFTLLQLRFAERKVSYER